MNFDYICVKVNSNVRPSSFMGSTLRGTFGHLLKEDVCIEPSYECKGCKYCDACLYYDFYESNSLYRSFRFDIRLDQKNYDFGLYLFGDHSKQLRTLIKVLKTMLASKKLTHEKISFPENTISLNNNTLTFDKNRRLDAFSSTTQTLNFKKYSKDISINILTPILIKDKNSKRPYKQVLTIEDILLSVYKRKTFFETKEFIETLPYIPEYKLLSSHFQDAQTKRRSDRQQQKIILKGVVGELIVTNLDTESYELLKWGEILAGGNKTAFGHGAIKLTI